MDTRFTAMGLSLLAAVLMLAGKMAAFFVTGSTAILSDAAESVVHILATAFAAFSLWYSMQAPDRQHPYGHGKIAYFSAGFEGALIAVAALSIYYIAFRSLIFGIELTELGLGVAITGMLAVINGFLGLFLVKVGRSRNSLVLIANGKNVLTDMWTSFGVVAGVVLIWLTGVQWLDPLVALIVALNISYTAFVLLRDAFHGLLDEADPAVTEQLLACMRRLVEEGQVNGFHQLRHRKTENILWVELHLLMPEQMTIIEAHSHINAVEEELRHLFPEYEVHITSHIEPDEHAEAHPNGHDGPEDPLGNMPIQQFPHRGAGS